MQSLVSSWKPSGGSFITRIANRIAAVQLTTVLYSVHVKRDPDLIHVTQDAVDRIDWTLREILWDSDQNPSIEERGLRRA